MTTAVRSSEPPAAWRLGDASLQRVALVLGERCGLRFDADKRAVLERGLTRAALVEGIEPLVLVRLIEEGPPEALLQRLMRQLTVGETYFFRHPEHFDALRDTVVPELLQGGRSRLAAWSAGCASGEETYSLAITLRQAAPTGCAVSVLGTDINREALERAERGSYGRWSQGESVARAGALVLHHADGTLTVTSEIRSLVSFSYLNLRDESYPSPSNGTEKLDIIFCRNVLVYFFPEISRMVLRRLGSCLAPGGFLITTAIEQDAEAAGLEPVTLPGGVVALCRSPSRRQRPAAVQAPRSPPPAEARSPAAPLTAPTLTAPQRTAPSAAASSLAGEAARRTKAASADLALRAARDAADRGDLGAAAEMAGKVLETGRSADALYLRALVLDEQGQHRDSEALLRELLAAEPDHVLAHLRLGMSTHSPRGEARWHLERVLALLAACSADTPLPGPEPLSAGWVRRMAEAVLHRMRHAERGP